MNGKTQQVIRLLKDGAAPECNANSAIFRESSHLSRTLGTSRKLFCNSLAIKASIMHIVYIILDISKIIGVNAEMQI